MKEIIIEKIYKNNKYNKVYYNELLRVNKELIKRWNIKTSLDKIEKLNRIDSKYNAYLFIDNTNSNFIGFGIISNEDGEDTDCKDIKYIYQKEKENNYWLANFFIYPEYRGKGYGNICFQKIYNELDGNNKSFYLYTDEFNFVRKIYSKYMKEINIHKLNKGNKIIYYKKFK